MTPVHAFVATQIEIGVSETVSVGSFVFNVDTIIATVAAGTIVIGLGLVAQRRATAGSPTRAQLAWETVISAADRLLGGRVGTAGRQIVPLAVTLFAFILVATLLETIPSGHPNKALPAPTGDLNLTAA